MKKWLALFLLPFVLLFSSPVNAADDITDHYFEEDMRKLIDLGYLDGMGPGVYQPDGLVSRAQFAAFLVRVLEEEKLEVVNPKSFSDVKTTDWYYTVVQQAAQMNIISGTPEGKFLPEAPITRETLASMMNSALEYKGIELDAATLTFKDSAKIQNWAELSVERMVGAGIIAGYGDNTFRPADPATRGITSAFLTRMIDTLKEQDTTTPDPKPEPKPEPTFELATVSASGTTAVKKFETYEEAKTAATQSNHVVLKDNKVVYMKSGIVSPAQVYPHASTLYTSSAFSANHFSLVAGTETEFIDAGDTWVKVKYNNTTGYFKMNQATLHPTVTVKGYSYYKADNGKLTHYTYNVNTNTYGPYEYGSSVGLPNGNYKSTDGHTFKSVTDGKVYDQYQYFNVMPLYTKTNYTAEQLNDFVKKNKPSTVGITPLETLGEDFKKAEAKYNVNAMYLLAHAIHETGWGNSELARNKKNLFGLKAYDGNAYENGAEFPTYEASIEELVTEFLLKPNEGYFMDSWKSNGEVLGNKELGLNVRYASDPYWGQKIAGYMYRMDNYFGKKERNQFKIAATLTDGVRVRGEATALKSNELYKVTKTGTPVLVLNEVSTLTGEGTWYDITPKNLNGAIYPKTFVYSHGGSYGTNMKLLPLAK